MSLVDLLCARGHVASARQLAAAGVAKRAMSSAVAGRLIRRVGRGVYACAHLDRDLVAALGAGCLIDGVSALARHDVWSGLEPHSLHLRARPHQHLGRVPAGTVVRWAETHEDGPHLGEVSAVDAVLAAMRCLPPDDALACLESALHLGYLGDHGLRRVHSAAPGWARRILARRDAGAQSGLETHARLRLLDAGHRVRTQVPVRGTSPIDLLVDDRVGVETDGRKWHAERFLQDRTKDIIVEGSGIRILRIGLSHIVETWPRTLATIERMIRDACP